MITQRTRGIYNFHVVMQCVLASVFFVIWKWMLPLVYSGGLLPDANYPLYCGLVVFGLFISAAPPSKGKGYWFSDSFIDSNRLAIRQTAFVGFTLSVYFVAAKDEAISRVFIFSYLGVLYFLLLLTNRYLPQRLVGWFFSGDHVEKTLLIGPVEKARSLREWLQRKKYVGIEPVGILSSDNSGRKEGDYPLLGMEHDLEKVVRERQINQVIMLAIPSNHQEVRTISEGCERLGVRFLLVVNFDEMLRHRVSVIEDDGFRFISLRQEPLEDPLNRFLKRALDLCIAWPVVILVLPWTTLLVWFLQNLQSSGPVFFYQVRSGLQNQPFTILKYRTMHVDNGDEARQATAGDARIFPAGRWLRKLSIDELPQFWNVLEGTMSVVGPRPHLPRHNEEFAKALANYSIRAFVKPGITGLAQTRGFRGETRTHKDIAHRLESDLAYLENWSLSLDLILVLRTVWQMVIPPRTAL